MSNSGTKEPSPQPSTAQSPPEPPRRGRGRPRKQQQKVEPVGERRPRSFRRGWGGALTALVISGSSAGGRGVDRTPLYLPQGLASSKQGHSLTPICDGDLGTHTHTHTHTYTHTSRIIAESGFFSNGLLNPGFVGLLLELVEHLCVTLKELMGLFLFFLM
ncbi:hypothetical protein INR49_029723 [Caranx melampygus]|nr:hypothetical protein INR49_029723 [Caranx melampygus]